MWVVRTILVLVLILLVVAFAYNNFGPDQVIDVKLEPVFPNYVDVPLVTVVFWSLLAGSILSMLLFVSAYVKQSVQFHSARKRIKALEGEVTILRNRPIEESADLLQGVDRRQSEKKSTFGNG
ncbi:MAG: hypothetical protein DRP45_00640 [Candidatus Zixiibacteriota bacterium]|nr:MAG: hypothetical protein DRP45_00640 [candidate division Zixibacteria bacterium]